MAVRAYILIDAHVGRTQSVATALEGLHSADIRVVSVDTVTGPHDVILLIECDDLDRLAEAITESVQKVPGVQRTVTCLTVRLA